MKSDHTINYRKTLYWLITIVAIISIAIGLSGIVFASAPEIIGEVTDYPNAITVTKIEEDPSGNALSNTYQQTTLSRGDSVTLGYEDAKNGNWFTCAPVNVEAAKAAPFGIDYDIVNGNGKTKIGVGNIKIIEVDGKDKIVFTIQNWSPTSKKWDIIAKNVISGFGPSSLSHPYTGNTVTIDCPTPINGMVYVFFHGQGVDTLEYKLVAVDFIFQILKQDPATLEWKGVPLNDNNVTFRDADGNVVSNGGAILTGGEPGRFTLKNGITAGISNLPPGDYRIKELTNDAYVATVSPNQHSDGDSIFAELTVSEDGKLQPVVFHNKMVSYELSVSKAITSDSAPLPADAVFDVRISFTGSSLDIVESNDERFTTSDRGKTWTGTLKADESVVFSNLPIGTGYVVEELNLRPGFTLETPTGNLKGAIDNTLEPGTPKEIELLNSYVKTVEFEFMMAKDVVGETGYYTTLPASWSFNFNLYESDERGTQGTLVSTQTATNSAPNPLFYIGINGDPGDRYYLLAEQPKTGGGITSSGEKYLIKVEVSEELAGGTGPGMDLVVGDTYFSIPKDGGWSIPVKFENDDPPTPFTFTNTYKPAEAKLVFPQGSKTISGSGFSSTTFTFVIDDITDAGNVREVARISRIGSGNITFQNLPAFTFDKPGTYKYQITELTDGLDPALWTSLASPITVYIHVTDNGSGTLAAKASLSDSQTGAAVTSANLTFRNTYTAPAAAVKPISTSLKAAKSASAARGSTLPSSWGFDIEIYESDANGDLVYLMDTKKAVNAPTSARTVTFADGLTFNAAGTYYYLIKEGSTSGNYWTVDASEYLIRITVTESKGVLSMSRQYIKRNGPTLNWPNSSTYKNYTDSIVTFSNVYEFTPGKISLTLTGAKSVTAGAPSTNFGFIVTQGGKLAATASRDNSGEFSFTLNYTQTSNEVDLYTYTISEDAILKEVVDPVTRESSWIVDDDWIALTEPITFYVQVRNEGGGVLTAQAFSDRGCTQPLTISDLTFFNEYTARVFDLALVKYVSKVNNTETGQTGTEQPADVPVVMLGDKVFYTIQVFNQGTQPGYVEKIVDYVPAGLEFEQGDNPDWTYNAATGKAYTTKLNQTLLQPGDTASVVIILTVSQSATPGRTLRNIAEICEHSDENHDTSVTDIDSTPDDDPDNDVIGGDNIIDNTNGDEDDHDYADVKVYIEPPPFDPPVTPDDEEEDEDDGDKKPPVVIEEEDEDDGEDDDDGDKPPVIVDEEDDDDDNGGGRKRPQIDFPDGEGPEDFPEIDFNKRQPNPDVPGGTEHDAPPVPNNPANRLTPQYNDDGDLIFIEFDDDDVPLGAWSWDNDEWVFEDFDVPLGGWEELPQTGYFNPMVWLMPLGLAIFGFGIILSTRLFDRSKQMKRVLFGGRK